MYAAFTWGQKKHEMRMVWIATVSNIDWTPNREFDPTKQQKAMVAMLDTFSKLNINAIAPPPTLFINPISSRGLTSLRVSKAKPPRHITTPSNLL